MFNIPKFYQDYNIPYWTEGKNVQHGWMNIQCPFCGDKSNHLGYNPNKEYYNCWLCGWHPIEEVITELLHISLYEAIITIKKYTTSFKPQIKKNKKQIISSFLKLPPGTKDLTSNQKNYLKNRNFDPEKLVREFGLKGSSHIGEYKFRIITPIYFNNKLISYQGRATNENTTPKYKACKKSSEIIHHKHILYNIDNAKKNKAIIVEGITDVWRLGHGAVATFGTNFTYKQAFLIKQKFSEVFILFDFDAQKKANQLAVLLSGIGIKSTVIELTEGDPANMSEEQAKKLIKKLLN